MSAYYRATVHEFLNADTNTIIGQLTQRAVESHATLLLATVISWERTLAALRATFDSLIHTNPAVQDWGILLEYEIPRRGRRIDAVLLAGSIVVVIEFKTGESGDAGAANRQAEHYALDLRDFHRESCGRVIIPIVSISHGADFGPADRLSLGGLVQPPIIANDATLAAAIAHAIAAAPPATIASAALVAWDQSPYEPIPTIIEAAQLLYAHQNVRELSHKHSDSHNLTATTDLLVRAIETAQNERRKIICFVTGVPGAGKTLAGLNTVHSPELMRDGRPAGAFLSGNRPLVKIISEALARDHRERTGEGIAHARRRIGTFIQGVHAFLKEYRPTGKMPPEHVIVFDEAQRAWNAAKSRKKALERATAEERELIENVQSEPALMLSILDRWTDWAVLVALVGGGQEIHDGEAGLVEWGTVQRTQFPHWQVWASPEAVQGGPSVAGSRLYADDESAELRVLIHPGLHLPVAVRSFRASAVAEWVNAVIAGRPDEARRIAADVSEFPIVLTRSLDDARNGLRGLHRCGLLASSGAMRLRANGIEVTADFRNGVSYEEWFLAGPDDIRASSALEIAATEFECQGLELDWTALCWGGDFTRHGEQWEYRRFTGSSWKQVQKPELQEFIRNKYRVLMTRAREGMVIWVPRGDERDSTRDPERLDSTAEYLLQCGVTMLEHSD